MTSGLLWFLRLLWAAAFYFLLFAPGELRRGLFRSQGPKDHYWVPAVAVAAAVALFLQSRLEWSLGMVALGLVGGVMAARGGYLVWRLGPSGWGIGAPTVEAAETEAPRLSIAHLLGLAVCLALYFGVARSMGPWYLPEILNSGDAGNWGAYAILGRITYSVWTVWTVTALSGLGLLAVRRWRGLVFPVHPGEYLWILLGAAPAIVLGVTATNNVSPGSTLMSLMYLILLAFPWALGLWALAHMDRWRWRVYVGVWIGWQILAPVVVQLLPASLLVGQHAKAVMLADAIAGQLANLGLVWPVVLDYREGGRRPWSHWTGVALWLSDAALTFVNVVFLWT